MKGKTMTCISFPCQPYFSRKNSLLKKQKLHDLHKYYCCAKIKSGSKNFENRITTSFSYKASVKAPLNEFPWASFDQYIEDKERVIQAIIPEKSTAKKLNEDEWRIRLNSIQVFLVTCQPIIHLKAKCISQVQDYPPQVPGHVTKFLEIQVTRCELEDLHYDHIPLGLNINAKGALYLEKEGRHNLIKNQIHITLSFVVPLLLKLVPEHVLQNILHSVLRSYVEDICNKGIGVRLLEDYNSFKMNKSEKTV
ncbi:uncharacterized protein LOC127115521 [Lathyrus oleraceus]|uniref:uncharacterized protein LOC127115521 n=1 Tax=Pisum sativum TaxID=3888 RepID=UPI0021CF756A|nr:uncharacterized protein LOC127115521 [Pisum sativum]